MTVETKTSNAPNARLLWLRAERRQDVDPDSEKALQLRDIALDLAKTHHALLQHEEAGDDPDYRKDLIDHCARANVALLKRGVTPKLYQQIDLGTVGSALGLAAFSASLLMDGRFETFPSRKCVRLQIQEQEDSIVAGLDDNVLFFFSMTVTPEMKRWQMECRRVRQVSSILGSSLPK